MKHRVFHNPPQSPQFYPRDFKIEAPITKTFISTQFLTNVVVSFLVKYIH